MTDSSFVATSARVVDCPWFISRWLGMLTVAEARGGGQGNFGKSTRMVVSSWMVSAMGSGLSADPPQEESRSRKKHAGIMLWIIVLFGSVIGVFICC